jgi:two-component system response regulator YesN
MNLLIVEDEKLIREGIAREFARHGFDVVQAADGDEAFETLKKGSIDAMILDLKMPKVDGLELLRLLAKEGIGDIETVVLTGYADLAFAQEAIHFGVKDYLLKPLVPEEVAQLSRELKEKIETRIRNADAQQLLLRQVEESKPVLRERLFWDLVGQQLDADALREKLEFLGISFPAGSFQVILLESEDGGRSGSRKKSLALMRALENRILDFFAAQDRVTVFHLSTRMFAILNNCSTAGVETCDMEGQLEKLTHGIAHDLGLAITVSLGTLVTGTGNIGTSYYNALSTLTYKELLGQGAILKSSDFLDDEESQKLAFTLEEVTFLVKTGQTQKLQAHIANTFDLISGASHKIDLTTIYLTCYKYICAILNAPVEYGIHVDELYRDRPNPLHDGAKRRTLEELRGWILEVAMEVVEYVSEFRRNRNSTIVEKVKAFIGLHYAQDVSNALVARTAGMSPNYLGQVFKRETGMSVNDYLNNFRIEEAKKLLKTTNLLVFEIAFKVGYKEQNYFSAVFRKRVGLTPKEYREA